MLKERCVIIKKIAIDCDFDALQFQAQATFVEAKTKLKFKLQKNVF